MTFIDSFDSTNTGWARFSEDSKLRYRLARVIDPVYKIRVAGSRGTILAIDRITDRPAIDVESVVFVMLNPSTADAFKVDPTVNRCCKFAARWGAHVLEVVNIFAIRSPYPKDILPALAAGQNIGHDIVGDEQILAACRGAHRVIAAWGNHGGEILDRGRKVKEMLVANGIELMHLGLSQHGHPLHPLARGKSFIPYEREPVVWA